MTDFECFEIDGKIHYFGVFHDLDQGEALRYSLDEPSMKAHTKYYTETEGMQLVDLELHPWKGKTVEVKPVK